MLSLTGRLLEGPQVYPLARETFEISDFDRPLEFQNHSLLVIFLGLSFSDLNTLRDFWTWLATSSYGDPRKHCSLDKTEIC